MFTDLVFLGRKHVSHSLSSTEVRCPHVQLHSAAFETVAVSPGAWPAHFPVSSDCSTVWSLVQLSLPCYCCSHLCWVHLMLDVPWWVQEAGLHPGGGWEPWRDLPPKHLVPFLPATLFTFIFETIWLHLIYRIGHRTPVWVSGRVCPHFLSGSLDLLGSIQLPSAGLCGLGAVDA